jgi:NADH dehydrogenase
MPEGADRPLPPTAQVANQQALHLIRHLPHGCKRARPLPSFSFRDLGALVALSDYNAFGTLGRFGFFTGRFIKGQFARLSHALLYRAISWRFTAQREPRCCGRPNESTRSCSRRFA